MSNSKWKSAMPLGDMTRDIAIMLRQRKSPAYIASVFGWSLTYFHEFCRVNRIDLPEGESIAPPDRTPVRPKRRAERTLSRPLQLSFNTEARIAAAIQAAAIERQTSVSAIIDRILTGAHDRGLWPRLLGANADSSSVASASNPNPETQG
jgi:hypothetical protein